MSVGEYVFTPAPFRYVLLYLTGRVIKGKIALLFCLKFFCDKDEITPVTLTCLSSLKIFCVSGRAFLQFCLYKT